jgi:hypothetical protein
LKLCVQKDNLMTPILKNFSLQAGGAHYPSINPKMQESFANIIIAECIKLAEADEDRYLEMGEPDLALAMANYQAMVKQHFGINNGRETSN